MTYFTKLPVNLPPVTSTLPCPGNSHVSIIDSTSIIKLFDLPWGPDVIRLIQAWVAPRGRVAIHKDADYESHQHQLWGLLFPVTNYIPPILEIYSPIDPSKISSTMYQTGPVPFLTFDNAKLEESYNVADGPIFFDSGTEWHAATNTSDNWHHCLSIRSLTLPRQEIYDFLVDRWK